MNRVVIDCDPGLDDALALAIAYEYAQVIGITTVAGNVPLEHTTANALRLTELLGVDTPVHEGSKTPRVGTSEFATEIHGEMGLGAVRLPEPNRSAAGHKAVEYLLDIAAPDLWVIATGPLTNISYVLDQDPQWLTRVAGLSVMGGSATVGNVTATAEFNALFDPEAAATVYAAQGLIKMCGLNLTHQVQACAQDVKAEYASRRTGRLGKVMLECLNELIKSVHEFTGSNEAALHDPCAVLAVTHPELFSFTLRSVMVETKGELTRGMTVVDQRKWSDPPVNGVLVATEVDAVAVKKLIFDAVFS